MLGHRNNHCMNILFRLHAFIDLATEFVHLPFIIVVQSICSQLVHKTTKEWNEKEISWKGC